jgi:hypothetical protein
MRQSVLVRVNPTRGERRKGVEDMDYRDSELVKRLISEGLRPAAPASAKGHGKSAGHPVWGEGCPATALQEEEETCKPKRMRKTKDTVRLVSRVPLLFLIRGGKA